MLTKKQVFLQGDYNLFDRQSSDSFFILIDREK